MYHFTLTGFETDNSTGMSGFLALLSCNSSFSPVFLVFACGCKLYGIVPYFFPYYKRKRTFYTLNVRVTDSAAYFSSTRPQEIASPPTW